MARGRRVGVKSTLGYGSHVCHWRKGREQFASGPKFGKEKSRATNGRGEHY